MNGHVGPEVSKSLNEASERLGEISQEQAQLSAEHDEKWELIFSLFDELGIDRFIASDGHTLTRQWGTSTAKLDEKGLYDAIFATYERPQAVRIWNSITDRRVNQDKLNKAVQNMRLDHELVLSHLSGGERRPSRVRREWTKEDKEKVEIFNPRPNNITNIKRGKK